MSNLSEADHLAEADAIVAQNFSTGSDLGGYTVTEVRIDSSSTSGGNVKIRSNSADNEPQSGAGGLVATLEAGTAASGVWTWTAPAGITLDPDTTYWVVINEGISNPANRLSVQRTQSDNETGTGWDIGNGSLAWITSFGGRWTTSTQNSIKFAIRGYAFLLPPDDLPDLRWQSPLTAAGDSAGYYGCGDQNCSSKLTDHDFEYDGTVYTVKSVTTREGQFGELRERYLDFRLDKDIPLTIRQSGALTVDGRSFSFPDGELLDGKHIRWTGDHLPVWTEGQRVSLWLTAPAPSAVPVVKLSSETLRVPEGRVASYTVVLTARPRVPVYVTVTKSSGDGDLNLLETTRLDFRDWNWGNPRKVRVKAEEDGDRENGRATFTHAITSEDVFFNNVAIPDVTAIEEDNDLPTPEPPTPPTTSGGETGGTGGGGTGGGGTGGGGTAPGPAQSSDAALSGLGISDLSIVFDPEKETYTAYAPRGTGRVTVTPTARDGEAVITLNGQRTQSGASVSVDLEEEETRIEITVTAEDGTERTYTVTVTTSCPEERNVLGRFHGETGGEDWHDSDNWNSSNPLGQWYGVRTDDEGSVVSLRLAGNGLSGELPGRELVCLPQLKELALWENDLTGEIPQELSLAVERAVLRDVAEALSLNAEWFDNYEEPYEFRDWHGGVTTNNDGRVTELDFTGEDVRGEIPRSVFELRRLEEIRLGCGVTIGEEEPEGVSVTVPEGCEEETADSGGCALGSVDSSASGLFLVSLFVFGALAGRRARD